MVSVSICQADLGLAERRIVAQKSELVQLFQSARQIWVWPNNIWELSTNVGGPLFQSARQIWVWPNYGPFKSIFAMVSVSICQADLGLAERVELAVYLVLNIRVSICQADLGLAELFVMYNKLFFFSSFNLPGRFGFGRTRSAIVVPYFGPTFQSARQIWVWPNANKRAERAEGVVSICQADLGLAELVVPLLGVGTERLFQSARQIWVWPNAANVGRIRTR